MTKRSSHHNKAIKPSQQAEGLTEREKNYDQKDSHVRLQLALKSAISPKTITEQKQLLSDPSITLNLAHSEIACARLFNFSFKDHLILAVEQLEDAITQSTDTQSCVMYLYDSAQDTYTCLNDEKTPEKPSRKIPQFSDDFLDSLLDTPDKIYTHIFEDDQLLGLVAVGDKTNQTPFTQHDELFLELISPYIAQKFVQFQQLKQSLLLQRVQKTVLSLSSQLIKAVDQENVLSTTLEAFGNQLNFDVCQYVQQVTQTEQGEVLLEYKEGVTKSLMHAGLQSKRKLIPHFSALIGLFKSIARTSPYLYLPGDRLGDERLKDKFNISLGKKTIYGALILPVLDPANGRIKGTLNLYRTQNTPIDAATLEMAQEMIGLVSLALSRVMVLEMALEMASTDELTGLTNRRGFYDRFEAEIERSRRHQSPLVVAMIDVDYFKKINDTYGHLNGDAVLHQLGQTINNSLRKSDLVCRFGGEEFAVLLPDTRFKDAQELLDRIRHKIETTALNGLDGTTIDVTISAGLSAAHVSKKLTQAPHSIISNALELADQQLYMAKHLGRNRVCANCNLPE